jgi:hypothetical protein
MQVHWVEGIRSTGPEADGGFWKNGAIDGENIKAIKSCESLRPRLTAPE